MAELRNSGNLANVLSGETHVLFAALGLFATGIVLTYWGWRKSNGFILAVGLVVTIGAAGIAVDVWAHEYSH